MANNFDYFNQILQGQQGDANTTSIVPRTQTALPKIDLQSLAVPNVGGLGTFAALTDATGAVTGISEDAFNAIQGSGGVGAMGEGFKLDKIGQPDASSGINFGIGDAIGVGQLGLGYLNYKDTKRYNDKVIQTMDQGVQLAQTEADATAAYRKSYGA